MYYLLSDYSVDKIVLAGAALGLTLLLKKTLLRKKLHRLLSLMPFVAGVALNLIAALFSGADGYFGEILKSGLSTGSAATVLYAGICGLTEEKKNYEETTLDSLIIEGLLAGYVADGDLTALSRECAEILRCSLPEQEEVSQLKLLLKEKTSASDIEVEMLVKIIRNTLVATED